MSGTFLLALHSHLPYVRGAGRWPHGEEWVHEAIVGTYLPLLLALHDLRDEGVPFRLTIGLTPTLLEQLAHPEIRERCAAYIADQVRRAADDVAGATTPTRRALAESYRQSYRSLREAFVGRFHADITGAFVDLARTGHVQLLTSAAAHGYLPLLDERSARRQLDVGIATTRRLTGIVPSGIWLPECAYRPGLEVILEDFGIDHFFVDAPLLGTPGSAGRPASAPARRSHDPSWTIAAAGAASSGATSDWRPPDRAYRVGRSAVVAIARDPALSGQVWSAQQGYPGDPAYREFHRKDGRSGLRYWRVSEPGTDLGDKAEYDIERARARTRIDARHFAQLVRRELAAARARSGDGAMVAATFDSELFGHWWYEGVEWLTLVLRELADVSAIAAAYLAAVPTRERIELREGSWGRANDHSTWLNTQTGWMWDELDRMAGELEALLGDAAPEGVGLRPRAVRQAIRELLLAQSSDWPFLVTTGQAAEYAIGRFRAHATRFRRTLAIARAPGPSMEEELGSLERSADLFPDGGDREVRSA